MEPPPFLPEELQLEILSWLPLKCLLRFRCVSQSWKSAISNSRFIKLHLHHYSSSRTRTNADFAHLRLLIDGSGKGYMPSRSVSSLQKGITAIIRESRTRYQFSGTCNGLVCLENHKQRFFRFRLWNPATRLISQNSPPLYYTEPCHLGFGYDSSADTYKVVVLKIQSRPSLITLNVYSMGDTCWRKIQLFHTPMYPIGDAVYVSGTLNWLAILPVEVRRFNEPKRIKNDPFMILSYDLGKENCTQLSLPYCPQSYSSTLGVLRGCLCFCYIEKEHFVVWQMKEFGVHKSWTLLFNITCHERIIPYVFWGSCFAMYMSENGDALLLSKSHTRFPNKPQVVLCIQKENKLQVMDIENDIVDCYAKNYTESLVSPC